MRSVFLRGAKIRKQPKLAGYYAVMSLLTLMFVALWLFEGYYLFTAWFPPLYDEITPINGVMAGAFMTLMLGCAVCALIRPLSMIGPAKVLIVGVGVLGVTMPLAFVMSNPLVTAVMLLFALTLLALVIGLHPKNSVVVPAIRGPPDIILLGLTIIIAVPFLWMAVTFQWSQITLDDEVAQRWFYGGYSMYLLTILSLMVVTSVDAPTRRFTATTAIFLTGLMGLVSVVYPTELHSLGFIGGGLLLAWCGCVAIATLVADSGGSTETD